MKRMRFILSSAVLTSPGTYRYRLITLPEARQWVEAGLYYCAIRYRETANALFALMGRPFSIRDEVVKMGVGDQALIFRLVFPPGTRGLPVDKKGRVDVEFILANSELGILERIS